LDIPPVRASALSPKLHFRLKRKSLQGLEPILRQCGVQTFACLGMLDDRERAEMNDVVLAAGFAASQAKALADLALEARAAQVCTVTSTVATPDALQHDDFDGSIAGSAANGLGEQSKRVNAESGGLPPAKRLQTESAAVLDAEIQKYDSSATAPSGCSRIRVARDVIDCTIRDLRSMKAEVVRCRDRATGKMFDTRVPSVVLALLRLHASCGGKEDTEQRLARSAADVMEEQGYDPVRAIASLAPGSLLCPTSAMRVLGSGEIGIVFLEERTGNVVKAMLEDFAKQEYDNFCLFANVGLAPRPIALIGPQEVPGGSLFSIRMEAITHTLHDVLQERGPSGQRRGLHPPSEQAAQRIGDAIVSALQRMWDHGLVHGDLHLENVAIKDPTAQPLAQVIDFGRSAQNRAPLGSGAAGALRAGHEYDVFRLLVELCDSFEELQEGVDKELKDCEKELRELRSTRESAKDSGTAWQMHCTRQMVGLQAYVADEPKSLEQVEKTYDTVVAAVANYASTKLDFTFDGNPSVRNKRMRQAAAKRQNLSFKGYFKSDLFWAGADG